MKKKKSRFFLIFLTLIVFIFSFQMGKVYANTYTVTSLADDGSVGTLRWAITQANWNGESPDTIIFSVSGTITLNAANGTLWIGNEGGTTIDASGQNIVIDASNVGNAFQIASNGNTITAGTGSLKIQGAQQNGIYITGSSNVIDGVEVAGTSPGSTYYGAITISGGDSNEVKNCGIHDNGGYGVIVANRATNTNIHDTEIYKNGQYHSGNFAASGIIVEDDGTDGTIIENNDIYQNDGNGIYILGGDSSGPAHTTIQDNDIHDNSMSPINGVGILIQGAVEGDAANPSVDINDNDIYSNYSQGILIENGGVGSPTYVKVDNNYIYSNGQEGVLIRDSGTDHNTVTANWIGFYQYSGFWPDPAPNGNSGIAIFNGAQYNDIDNNIIAYNQYQNILISGSGTDNNTVRYNWILGGTYTSPQVGYDNSGIVIIDGAQSNTIGPGNTIQYHKYDGIQIVGDDTDYNEVSSNDNTHNGEISHNSSGIVVINTYVDAAHGYDLQLGPATSGPAGTLINSNDIMTNSGSGIILRYIAPRSEGVTTISSNAITDNGAIGNDVGNGVYCIGSSPDITGNTITGNHENGIKLVVYFGDSDSPFTANDDVLSDGTSMTISGNTIGGTGLTIPNNYTGAGIYAIDTPLGDISSLYSNNTWSADDDVCHIQQDWYGYVKVVDSDGNGITGETVIVEQGGDALGWGWTYTLDTYDTDGNYGPSGFDIDHERTYQKIVEKRVKNDGTSESFTPQRVYLQGTTYKAEYSYNGKYPDPSNEIGGAIESPSGSDWDRYQYAQITKLSASPDAGKVVINEVLYIQTCDGSTSAANNDEFIELYFTQDVDISGWIISDGNIVNGDIDGVGGFSLTFPVGSSFQTGDYVMLWIGSSDDPNGLKNATNAAAQFYAGKNFALNNDGDDIWLFDDNNRLVDYMAYGSDNAINDQSYLPSGFWDGNNAPAGATYGQSISLTPNGVDTNSGLDWELTTSDSAPGPITRDTDDASCNGHERITSVGKNNNGVDYGDAPASYQSAGSSIDSSLYMGSNSPDDEDSPNYSDDANGDDNTGVDDEDGVSDFPLLRVCDTSYTVQVSVFNSTGEDAYLMGWIDFDGNGVFDSDEASDVVVSDGTNGLVSLTWSSIPNDIQQGDTYVRLRISSESLTGDDAAGFKGTGEVEDYKITIESCEADLSITKSVDNNSPNVGENVTFTITITNNGPSDATGVEITDSLPSGLTYVSSSTTQGTYNSGTGVWNVGDLTNGSSATLTITARVDQAGTITNTAQVTSSDQHDPDSTNNQDSATINGQEADLSITKIGPDIVNAGDSLTYTITVKNNGPSDAQNVTVTDTVPEEVQNPEYSMDGGDTWNTWTGYINLGTIAANDSVTILIRGTVSSSATGTISNTASVTSDTDDPDTSNNFQISPTTVSRISSIIPNLWGVEVINIGSGETFAVQNGVKVGELTLKKGKNEIFVDVYNRGVLKAYNVKLEVLNLPWAKIEILPEITDIPKRSVQTYIVSLDIPESVPSGLYTIEIRAKGNFILESMEIEIEIR